MPKGSSGFSKLRTMWLPGPSPHRELRMLCEGLWCANQLENRSTSSAPWHRALLSKRRREISPFFYHSTFIPLPRTLLSRIVPRKWWNSEFGMWIQNSSFFNLDHGLLELRWRCRLSSAVTITYNYLGPFSITTTLLRTQERLHLCQNSLGKPFTAPNFLMHCVPCLLFLAVSIRCKKSTCDFVKVWKGETPLWVFLNFSTLFFCQHVDVWCNMKNSF